LLVAFDKATLVAASCLLDHAGFKGALGIVDSDFDGLDGKVLPSPNIVRVDCHDLEAMLVRSPALDAVLHEFASPEKLTRFESRFGRPLRAWLTQAALPLGYLRWNSLRAGLNLRFEGLRFSSFIDVGTLELKPAALLVELKNRSQNWAVSDQQLTEAGWPADRHDNPWHVCCGHDMTELLALALRRVIGSRQGLTASNIASGLRLAYNHQDFLGSEVRAAISRWQETTGFSVLAPTPTAAGTEE
jgi:hypothetical protein